MRFTPLAGIVLAAALLSGCSMFGDDNNPTAGATVAPTTEASAEPEPNINSPSAVASIPASPRSTTAESGLRKYDMTSKSIGLGAELTTTITRVTCVGEPISGIYLESATGSNKRPFGPAELGHNSSDRRIEVIHHVLAADPRYRVNIGCGYVPGGDNDWLHEFNLAATMGGRTNNFVCQNGKGCTLDGKAAAFRR